MKKQKKLSFFLILEHFLSIYLEHIYAPLLGLSWKAEIYRPKDLRPGPLSIPQKTNSETELLSSILFGKYNVCSLLLKLADTDFVNMSLKIF